MLFKFMHVRLDKMTIEEAIKAMQAKRPVYYMGDCYDIIYCKQSTTGDVAIVRRRSLSNRYGPVEIEPRFLSLEASDV
ncbi:hypothetical protein [Limosilactobacillus antri]|uniref:hypothetical protein n=1 Tax=Limosilactobacillus antri TaxID=227943 RepID=UPI001F579D33|nr:hypothetical protein [Limosilactobacillus antri]